MRHLLRLAGGLNVMSALHSVTTQGELWEDDVICLRYPPLNEAMPGEWGVAAPRLPHLRQLTLAAMMLAEAHALHRAVVTRQAPRTAESPPLEPTVDMGRYLIVLQGGPGALLRIHDEAAALMTGEAWWVDPSAPRELINESSEDLILYQLDLRLWR